MKFCFWPKKGVLRGCFWFKPPNPEWQFLSTFCQPPISGGCQTFLKPKKFATYQKKITNLGRQGDIPALNSQSVTRRALEKIWKFLKTKFSECSPKPFGIKAKEENKKSPQLKTAKEGNK